MEDALIDWDEVNTAHVAENDLTPYEVESVLRDPNAIRGWSESTGRDLAEGRTFTGRWVVVVFEVLNKDDPYIIRPVTAYEPDDPLG